MISWQRIASIASRQGRKRPRVCILVDTPKWAYDNCARQIREHLCNEFDISIAYRAEVAKLDPSEYDLLHICFWGEESHKHLGFASARIVKEISSHRWQYDRPWGPISPEQFTKLWLADCDTAICTSRRLQEIIAPATSIPVMYTPNGVNVARFRSSRPARGGELVLGWSGNANDPVKRFAEIILPATTGRRLIAARGDVAHRRMPRLYKEMDIFLVASAHEASPLPLLEAMAAGCFPVCTNVGVVPELIEHKRNGYIVKDETAEGFRRAIDWCEANRNVVHLGGVTNANLIGRERSWAMSSQYYARAYRYALVRALPCRFRNDDVSWDSSLPDLQRFSEVFYKHRLTQVHGVCLNGRTNSAFWNGSAAVEYEHCDSISRLPNAEIRRLSQGMPIADRRELVDWLNACPDELALHGLYHTDYSVMAEEEQEAELTEGLRQMRRLFPQKAVRYFIAPFNRTNEMTYRVAEKLGLSVLAEDGIHLEQAVHEETLQIVPGLWYRYHHHRFYPSTKFDYFKLSIERLDMAIEKCFSMQPSHLGFAEQASQRIGLQSSNLPDPVKRRRRMFAGARKLYRALVAALH